MLYKTPRDRIEPLSPNPSAAPAPEVIQWLPSEIEILYGNVKTHWVNRDNVHEALDAAEIIKQTAIEKALLKDRAERIDGCSFVFGVLAAAVVILIGSLLYTFSPGL